MLQDVQDNVECYSDPYANKYIIAKTKDSSDIEIWSSFTGSTSSQKIFSYFFVPSTNSLFEEGLYVSETVEVYGIQLRALLDHFDLSKIQKLRLFWESYEPRQRVSVLDNAASFTSLKEVGVIHGSHGPFMSFIMALPQDSLTKIEMIPQDSRIKEVVNLLMRHNRTLVSIVYKNWPRSRSGGVGVAHTDSSIPFIFRALKLDEFPKLQKFVYDGGVLHIERNHAEPMFYYSPY